MLDEVVALADVAGACRRRGVVPGGRGEVTGLFVKVRADGMQAVGVAQEDLFGEIVLRRHRSFDAVFASGQPVSAIEREYR